MSYKPTPRLKFRAAGDFPTLASAGWIEDVSTITKFGRSTNVDNGVVTDIHDGANATTDLDIWVAPTAAVIHNIASTDGDDASGGVGAKTIKIYGLTSWDTAEVSETISMNGATDVPTLAAYVIIHRMHVVTKGASGPNAGIITATTDNVAATVTAQINIGEGQTQMAIFGIPSTQTLYVGRLYGNVNKSAGATGAVDVCFCYNPEPDVELTKFLTKHTFGLMTTGTSALTINYAMPKKFAGPGILKINASGSADNLDVSAGFDGYLVTD